MSDLRIDMQAIIDELASIHAWRTAVNRNARTLAGIYALAEEIERLQARVDELEAALNKLRIWCSEEPSLSSTDIIELLEALENNNE